MSVFELTFYSTRRVNPSHAQFIFFSLFGLSRRTQLSTGGPLAAGLDVLSWKLRVESGAGLLAVFHVLNGRVRVLGVSN